MADNLAELQQKINEAGLAFGLTHYNNNIERAQMAQTEAQIAARRAELDAMEQNMHQGIAALRAEQRQAQVIAEAASAARAQGVAEALKAARAEQARAEQSTANGASAAAAPAPATPAEQGA